MLRTNADIVGGTYWNSMQEWIDTTVEINKVKRVPMLTSVKVEDIEHESDYIEVGTLSEYGG